MAIDHHKTEPHMDCLLSEVERFLKLTGMSSSYLGKRAVGNSEIVKRLRNGGTCYSSTEQKLRAFMREREAQFAGQVRS
jgi:hypothetical protein